MASILKVDTIQDQAGNNIISEAANIITIGASGDTITVPAGATVSGFTSAGIDDNATSVAITIDSSENVGIKSTTPSSDAWNGARTLVLKETSGDNGITIISSSATNNGNIAFADTSGGGFSDIGGLITYLHNGDSFRFMTANAERMRLNSTGLGIGTSSPTQKLDVNGTVKATAFEGDGSSLTGVTSVGGDTGVDFNDNVKARFGTGNDLEIYHEGSHSFIDDTGTGRLYIRGNDGVYIQRYTGEDMIKAIANGAVNLYYDNNIKLATTSNGLDVTGHIIPAANDTYDLGETGNVWRNIYTGDLHLSNEAKDEGNAVDGTKGNWTIQEGSEDLFIVNNKSGKKYKFKLEEI